MRTHSEIMPALKRHASNAIGQMTETLYAANLSPASRQKVAGRVAQVVALTKGLTTKEEYAMADMLQEHFEQFRDFIKKFPEAA